MTTKIITLSLPSELLKDVDRYCKKNKFNRSEYLRKVLRESPQDIEMIEQLQVQLAGISTAALGWNSDPAKQGDYGWSRPYQDVLELRLKYDKLLIK